MSSDEFKELTGVTEEEFIQKFNEMLTRTACFGQALCNLIVKYEIHRIVNMNPDELAVAMMQALRAEIEK